MGSIASVLQWHCEKCKLINPTEQVKCIRCGTTREFKPPRPSGVRGRSASFNERSFKYSTFTTTGIKKEYLRDDLICSQPTIRPAADSNSAIKTGYDD